MPTTSESSGLSSGERQPPSAATKRFWAELLPLLEEGRVVAIVGPDLLRLQIGGREVSLYDHLARELAASLEVPDDDLPEQGAIDAVVRRHLVARGESALADVYPALKGIVDDLGTREGTLPIPEPLEKLARVGALKLFVSTTFDSLLERALDEARFGGRSQTLSLAYHPSEASDLPCELRQLDRPAVFHILGRLSAVPAEYAVTEENVLEFVHALHVPARRPQKLFDELHRNFLLVIGCGFPDWLARFFIRIAKPGSIWESRGKSDFIVDDRLERETGLVSFLRHYSPRTRIFSGGSALEFVDELHERWVARHPEGPAASTPVSDPALEGTAMEPGAVFLSYAHEDGEVAEAIRAALDRAGIAVWLDRNALRGGDRYEEKIKLNIESACAFVPIISRSCLTPERRFFRLEWDHAVRVLRQQPKNARFVLPVVVDDTPYAAPEIHAEIRDLHWTRMADEILPDELVAELKAIFRTRERERRQGVG